MGLAFNYAPPTAASMTFNYAPPGSAPPPQPGFLSSVLGGAKAFASDAYNALTQPVTTPKGPFTTTAPPSTAGDIALSTLNSYANTLSEAKDKMNNLSAVANDQHASLLQKGLAVGEAGIAAIQSFFAPISAAAVGAEHIPLLGGVAHAINNVFSMVGSVGADTLEGAVQSIPYISQDTKDKVTPLAREIGALGLQIIAGKGGGDAFDALSQKTGEFIDTMNTGLKGVQAMSEVKSVPVTGESVASPVKLNFASPEAPVAPETASTASITPEGDQSTPSPVTTSRTTQTLKPIEGTGELKTRGVSQSLEASAIQKGLTTSFENLPEFKGADFGKIASDINDHIAQSPEDAMKIAMGEKAAPKGSIPEMYLNVLSKKAALEGDVGTIQKLATESKLTGGATTMGQRIAALGYQKDAIDPVAAVRDVQEARAASLKARGIDQLKEATKDEAVFRNEVKTARAPKQSWADFAKQITCNI